MLGTLAAAWFLKEKEKLQMQCEVQVLRAQDHLVLGAEKLMALNPSVDALVIEKKALRTAIAVAVTPAEKAALAAQLAIVIFKISALRTQQRLIVKNSEAAAFAALAAIEKIAAQEALRLKKFWRSRILKSAVRFRRPMLMLEKRHTDPSIPTYHAPLNFSQLQTIDVNISIFGSRLFEYWLRTLETSHFNWQENCSSHPRQGGLKWQSYLGKGKFYGSSSYSSSASPYF